MEGGGMEGRERNEGGEMEGRGRNEGMDIEKGIEDGGGMGGTYCMKERQDVNIAAKHEQ